MTADHANYDNEDNDVVYVDFASVILFGDQVLGQFAPGTGPPVGAEWKLGRARESHPDHRRHQQHHETRPRQIGLGLSGFSAIAAPLRCRGIAGLRHVEAILQTYLR
jgi:hypothetical protein